MFLCEISGNLFLEKLNYLIYVAVDFCGFYKATYFRQSTEIEKSLKIVDFQGLSPFCFSYQWCRPKN